MRYRDAMRSTAEATQPPAEALRRVQHRLALGSRPLHPSLREDPGESQLARLRARFTYRRPARVWPRIVLVSGTLIVGAAAALVALRTQGPAPVASDLVQLTGHMVVQPSPFVSLHADGEGWVSGTERDLLVTWDRGKVLVEVEPDQDVSLQVVTSEGKTWVTGTAFTVSRDVRGTEVEVIRGHVQVACTHDGVTTSLRPGQAPALCLPTNSETLNARAQEMMRLHEPPEDILLTIDEGLEDAEGYIRGELLTKRARVLAELGRDAEALAAIQSYEDEGGGPRTAYLQRLAAQLDP